MAATLEIHFLMLKYTHCQFCQNYPKKVAKIKLILAKLAFATDYEASPKPKEALLSINLHIGYMKDLFIYLVTIFTWANGKHGEYGCKFVF